MQPHIPLSYWFNKPFEPVLNFNNNVIYVLKEEYETLRKKVNKNFQNIQEGITICYKNGNTYKTIQRNGDIAIFDSYTI